MLWLPGFYVGASSSCFWSSVLTVVPLVAFPLVARTSSHCFVLTLYFSASFFLFFLFFFLSSFLSYFHFCSWWRWLHLCRVCPETLELVDLGGFHISSVSISTISPFPTPKFLNLGVTFFTSISAQNGDILQFYQIVDKLFFKLIPGSDFLRTIQQYYKTLHLGFYLRASSS